MKQDTENFPLQVDVPFLEKVIQIITENISDPDLSPIHITKAFGLSISQINRKINASSGFSTHNFIIQLRIVYAKRQLSNPDKPINEIAKSAGFTDLAYFSRTFKKHVGITPSFYRNLFI